MRRSPWWLVATGDALTMPNVGLTVVTGANGFIGRHLCRGLTARGVKTRAASRRPDSRQASTEQALVPDLLDRPALRRALEGADAVVHLAARVHVMRELARDPAEEFQRVNVEGTRTLLEEAVRAGVRRFLFVSSVKAMGEGSLAAWTEDTPPRPVDEYGKSKLAAEALVLELSRTSALGASIIRLPLVYGPGMKGNMLRLFDLVERGLPVPSFSDRNRRSMAFVENVVEAIRAVLSSDDARGEVFLVSDREDTSTRELVRLIGAALERPARTLPVPLWALRPVGRIGDALARALPFPITTAVLDRLGGSLLIDSSKLRRVTGFNPPFTIEEGLRATAAWYRTRKTGCSAG